MKSILFISNAIGSLYLFEEIKDFVKDKAKCYCSTSVGNTGVYEFDEEPAETEWLIILSDDFFMKNKPVKTFENLIAAQKYICEMAKTKNQIVNKVYFFIDMFDYYYETPKYDQVKFIDYCKENGFSFSPYISYEHFVKVIESYIE